MLLDSAAFANAPSGLFVATPLIVLMGAIFGYYFLLIVSMLMLDFHHVYNATYT